jgi:hypothetical protein
MAMDKLKSSALENQLDVHFTPPHDEATLNTLAQQGITRELQVDGSYRWFAIHPKTMQKVEIDPEQRWFWSSQWQELETQADDDLQSKSYKIFDDFNDFLNAL